MSFVIRCILYDVVRFDVRYASFSYAAEIHGGTLPYKDEYTCPIVYRIKMPFNYRFMCSEKARITKVRVCNYFARRCPFKRN